jgi:hypothetical protein
VTIQYFTGTKQFLNGIGEVLTILIRVSDKTNYGTGTVPVIKIPAVL